MKKSNVTVLMQVYNEESRLEACLKNFSWADEIIVFVKQSTDRTLEIAQKYATEVISIPFSAASESIVKNFSNRGSCSWLLFPSAADFIHPNLAAEIVQLTSQEEFDYDVIGVPYGLYVLGIRSARSPWVALRKNILIRKSVLKLSNELHKEVGYDSNRIFNMPLKNEDEVMYHCTHKNGDAFFMQHMRYTKYEAEFDKSTSKDRALWRALYEILKSIFNGLFRQKTILLGWDGVALGLAYVSYFIMKFIYVWDSRRENRESIYPEIQEKIEMLWKSRSQY